MSTTARDARRLRAVLQRAADGIATSIGDGVVISLATELGDWIVPVAVAHVDPFACERLRERFDRPVRDFEAPHLVALSSKTPVDVDVPPRPSDEVPLLGTTPAWHGLAVSLRARAVTIGTVVVVRERRDPPFSSHDRVLLVQLAANVGRQVERARLRAHGVEGIPDRVHLLSELGSALAGAPTADACASLLAEATCAAVSAHGVAVALIDHGELRERAAVGAIDWVRGELPERVAARAALEEDGPIWGSTGEAWRARFAADLARASMSARVVGIVAVPLVATRECVGAITLFLQREASLDEDLRAFVAALAKMGAQAIARAQADEREHAARRRSALLAEVARALSATLDPAKRARAALELLVPSFVDACALERADVEGAPLACAGSEALLRADAPLSSERRVRVPLAVRGVPTGALVAARSEAPFDDEERAFLEEVAGRVALAVDNARLYAEAREAVEVRDRFLAVAGHELRTPLSTLGMYVFGLARVGPEALPSALGVATRQIARLDRLVDLLLDVARVTSGRLVLERSDADLVEIAEEVLRDLDPEIRERNAAVRLVAPPSLAGRWDETRVGQVLGNLLSNALRYGGTPIDLELQERGTHAVVVVRDGGTGMTEERRARVFARFERAVPARSGEGLGVGLWLARHIVEAHGGTMSVRAAVGCGTELEVELPRELAS